MKWLWLLPLLLAFAWTQGNGYEGLSEQDSHDYFRIAKEWRAWHDGGPIPAATEHPQFYPMLGALLSLVTGDVLWAMRLIPLLSFVLIGVCVRSILRRAFPEAPQLNAFILLAIGASPFLLRHALVVMSDVPAMALCVLAFLLMLRAMQRHSLLLAVLAVITIGPAMGVRLAVAPVGFVLVAFPFLFLLKRRIRRVVLLLLIVLAVVAYLLIPAGTWAGSPLADWSPLNLFRRQHYSDDGLLAYTFPNILYVCSAVVHPGLLPIGVLLLPFVRRDDLKHLHAQFSLWIAAAYLLFIAGMPFQNDRVLLLALPFIVIPLFPAFGRAWAWLQGKNATLSKWALPLLLVAQLTLFARAMAPFIRRASTEREVARAVEAYDEHRVYTHGMGGAIHSYCSKKDVIELWYTPIDTFEHGALVVIKPGGLEEQWHGLPPAINWQRIQQQGIERLSTLPEGWELHRLR